MELNKNPGQNSWSI